MSSTSVRPSAPLRSSCGKPCSGPSIGLTLPGRPSPGRPGPIRHRSRRHGSGPACGMCGGEVLTALDFPGYALGGFSVGETPEQMALALPATAALLPANKPRYLMGVGRPQDILTAVAAGVDMFDCVLPTRNGRNASAFTATGPLRLRNACHKDDPDHSRQTVPATRSATSAGPTCTIYSRPTKCLGRRCCRSITWPITAAS